MADTALATQSSNQISFAPRNLQEAFHFADMVLVSGMAPKSYLEIYSKALEAGDPKELAARKAQSAIVVALQFGMEVGFQPMQALQCIANINGNPSVWGDGALGLVMSSGLMEKIQEDDFDTIKANRKAVCIVKRKGDPVEKKVTFSYEDAEKAGIFARGVWKTYPYRMCQARARAFALRDKFPDVLKGLKIAEEVMDYDIDVPQTQPQPKPQGQITVPTTPQTLAEVLIPKKDAPATEAVEATPVQEEPAQTAEAAPEPENVEPDPTDDPEMVKALAEEAKKWATGYYAAYKAAGKTPEESKAFLVKQFSVEDSRQVPVGKREFAMEQAKSGFPVMQEPS